MIRWSGQFTTETPFRYRDPITTSLVPHAAIMAGRYFGSCDQSPSIWQISAAKAVHVRAAEPARARAVHHLHASGELDGQRIGDLARAVGRLIVHDHHA